jgi:cardiolipin synthase
MNMRGRRGVLPATVVAVAALLVGCRAPGPTAPSIATSASQSTSGLSTAPNRTTPGQLSLLVEPDQGMAPIYALIASARKSIDLTMYELVDTDADLALELAAGRGVNVRVLLDVNLE